jgi:hypothetical protein
MNGRFTSVSVDDELRRPLGGFLQTLQHRVAAQIAVGFAAN